MKSPADGANSSLLPSGSVERSVGYLIIGIGVILFFLLTIFGMERVEKLSTDATQSEPRVPDAPASEIGGARPAFGQN